MSKMTKCALVVKKGTTKTITCFVVLPWTEYCTNSCATSVSFVLEETKGT